MNFVGIRPGVTRAADQAASRLCEIFSRQRHESGCQKQSDPAGGHPGRVVGGYLGGL